MKPETLQSSGPLYTYRQAGQILGVSDRTVWTLVKDGKLKAVRFGRTVRISDRAIQAFIQQHEGRAADVPSH